MHRASHPVITLLGSRDAVAVTARAIHRFHDAQQIQLLRRRGKTETAPWTFSRLEQPLPDQILQNLREKMRRNPAIRGDLPGQSSLSRSRMRHRDQAPDRILR